MTRYPYGCTVPARRRLAHRVELGLAHRSHDRLAMRVRRARLRSLAWHRSGMIRNPARRWVAWKDAHPAAAVIILTVALFWLLLGLALAAGL